MKPLPAEESLNFQPPRCTLRNLVHPGRNIEQLIQGLVYRIYRASSHWCYVHEGLTKAKEILERNQYPPQFYDSIFKETLEKIIVGKENVNVNVKSEDTPEKPSKVSVFLQYRGHQTDLFAKRLRDSGAPLQSILTMRKLKTVLPSLKSSTKEILRSRVVNKLTCPGCNTCYVGQTTRHLLTRFREHKNDKSGPVFKHFQECLGTRPNVEDIEVLCKGPKNYDTLLAIEALIIREIKPKLNTKDEYRSRELTIKF